MRFSIFNTFLATGFATLVLIGCNHRSSHKDRGVSLTREQLLEANRRKVDVETARIDSFIAQTDWEMIHSGTGLRYDVYHHGYGDSARAGMVAEISYKAILLNGKPVASTPPGETISLRIGHNDEVSGLHQAVELLAVGDSARFILPSHLAYGLTGLNHQVPPNAAIFYDLHLVRLR